MAAPTKTVVFLFVVSLISRAFGAYPFQNISLPISVRVADLIKRLTLEEIAMQMAGAGGGGMHGGNPSPAIPRLGIGKFVWSVECLRGDAMAGKATSFPQAIGLAATFNPQLLFDVANATASEVRGKNNDFVKKGIFHDHTGLSCFSPVVNIMRHPLWGRNQETYGEDPYLTGELAAAFVAGLQGVHPRYLQTAATCKHFDAYSGPEDLPIRREAFNARVTEYDLYMTYLPQFKKCLEAGASGVMCSYNSLNNVPACLNKFLLTDILRTSWKFPGYIVSDAGALEFSITWHHYLKTFEDTAAAAVSAGLNLELAPDYANSTVFGAIPQAVKSGKITEQLVRQRAVPVFTTRMKLGEFDPPTMNPYSNISIYNLSLVQNKRHQDIALKAAIQSLVLLKNNGTLPLKKQVPRLAMVGPMAANLVQIMGDYAPDTSELFISSVVQGTADMGVWVSFTSGCNGTKCTEYWPHFIHELANTSNMIFVCLGTGQAIENENYDRRDMNLPGKQSQLLEDVIKLAKGPVILILFSGGPLDIRMAVSSPKVAAILHCFFPAQATGLAIASVMTMKTNYSNPGGRLPFTWYPSQNEVFNITDYNMHNKTYRYYTGKPLYPFGYGLSYSTFNYSDLKITPTGVKVGQSVQVSFRVTNLGPYDGDEVVQVYMSWGNPSIPAPRLQLVAFNRYHIIKGWWVNVKFTITSEQMAVWITGKGFQVAPGKMTLYTGHLPATDPDPKVQAQLLRGSFTVA